MNEFQKIQQLLNKKAEELKQLKRKVDRSLKKAPEGRLVLSKSHGTVQYIHKGEQIKTRGNYIEKKNTKLISSLAQKEYDLSISEEIKKQESLLEFLSNHLPDHDIPDIYTALPPAKKPYVIPHILTDEQYAEKWLSTVYIPNPYPAEFPLQLTDRGEHVRSKSEKMLADKLYAMGIPYRYEAPLYLEGNRTVYPDFTLLKIDTREEFYLEHFGMMNKSDYCEKAILKLREYAQNGIYPGKNLLLTFETENISLDMKLVEQMLKEFLFF